MAITEDPLAQSLDAHLDVEQAVLEAVCNINDAMADVLSEKGIQGPSEEELRKLEPLLTELRQRSEQSLQSRTELFHRFDRLQENTVQLSSQAEERTVSASLFARLSQRVPQETRGRLDQRRRSLSESLADAQATLASNQVLVYYSMDFHRRYLMGVLHNAENASENAAYSADGQAFSPQPETLFGRNC
ncbi:MAG: hypothetical protein AAF802_02755 [Planctomycetota bacterium]